MIAESKKETTKASPASSRALAVIGANSVFEPSASFVLDLTEEPASRRATLRDVPDPMDFTNQAATRFAGRTQQRAEKQSHSVPAWIQAGLASLSANDARQATRDFEKALALDSTSRGAALGLARALHEDGRFGDAESVLRNLLTTHPNDAEALASLGVVLVTQQRTEDALAVLSADLAPSTATATLFATRGSVLLMAGRPKEAISDLRKVVRIRPEWVHPRNLLGLAEMAAGNQRAAERQFRAACRIGPMYQEPLKNLARLLGREKRWEDLLRAVEHYWRPGSGGVDIALHAAEACLALDQVREARSWLEPVQASGRSPRETAHILNDLGVAFSRMQSWREADAAFARSVEALPSDLNVANRGLSLVEADSRTASVAWLLKWYNESKAAGVKVASALASGLYALQQYDGALAVIAPIVEREDAPADAFMLLSCIYSDWQLDYASGARIAKDGLSRFPKENVIINNLAYALAMSGHNDEAEQWLASLPFDGLSADRRVYLFATQGLIQLHRGDISLGRSLYEKALTLAGSPPLRERVRVKRDLEVARALLSTGQTAQASALLQRAAEGAQAAEPYASHARRELKLLKGAVADDRPGPDSK